MCLNISRFRHPTLKPKKARRNIPCYKILSMRPNGRLETPYWDTPVTFDDVDNGLRADFFQTTPTDMCIEHAIHSYKRPPVCYFTNCIVVKCYIPRGALYWSGREEYASEMIVFNCQDVRI